MSAANDTLVASPLTATSGQPGPVAMLHAMCPPTAGAKPTPTTSESPGASVCGPPPLVTVKSPQLETTFKTTAAVPALRTVNCASLLPPTATRPKSSAGTDTVH